MSAFYLFALVAVGCCLSEASAATTTINGMQKVAVPIHRTKHRPLSASAAKQHKRGAQRTSTYPDPLRAVNGEILVINVSIGSPPQNFSLFLNTFEGLLWVIDCYCTGAACVGQVGQYQKRCFNKRLASTFVNNGSAFSTVTCDGYMGTDTVHFAGLTDVSQEFGVADNVKDFIWADLTADGSFGLGWPEIAPDHSQPPIQHLLSQFGQPMFTIWLNSPNSAHPNTEGYITFGGVDTTHCANEWHKVPLEMENYWQYIITSVSIGTYRNAKKRSAITYTGSTSLIAPSDDFNAIVTATQAEFDMRTGKYLLDCSSDLPDLVFTMNGQNFNISQKFYMRRENAGNCYLALEEEFLVPAWQMGNIFIEAYCHLFDVGTKSISLAKSLTVW